MERIDLSQLTDRQLQMHADRAQNDHFLCGQSDNRPGMVMALAEYYRIRVEQSGRRVAQLRIDGATLEQLHAAETGEALAVAQLNYWSGVAAGQQAVAV
ncbi:hypothetical protein [Kushneria konosiri]|uniref:Uncharacterized protein n=1 Tax=Kushneria konosiri TaxID=698828 RepID=A0A2Z2H2Z4_9GAMM|nr:hypothetical protein [Kushneria konosiri]ARS51523.1 hypothetical protein B9G99_00245 [Kushneria konosiri]